MRWVWILLSCALVIGCSKSGGSDHQDLDSPTITIDTPTTAGTYAANVTPLGIGGSASDNGAVARVDWLNSTTGASAPAIGTDTWTAMVPLVAGVNAITVTAIDGSGNTATDAIAVTLDQADPTVTIITPTTAGTYDTGTTPITVGGIASDNDAVASVAWSNGATGSFGTATGTTTWTAVVDLIAGANLVTITAFDPAGNTATDTITMNFDQTGPTVTVDTPTILPVYGTLQTPVSLAGTAADPSGVTTVDWANATTGASGAATGTTAWTAAAALAPGANSITVTATDTLGNTGSDTITVTLSVGEVYAWGDNDRGQIGNGSGTSKHFQPTQVVDPSDPTGLLTGVATITGGSGHTVAALSDGTVRCWGWGSLGRLGNGAIQTTAIPVQVVDPADPTGFLTGVSAVAAGTSHSLALLLDGTVRSWGYNGNGQLGDGTMGSYSSSPVQVVDPPDPTGFLTGVVAVAGGNQHSLALLSDGTVRAWGWNPNGELGDGTFNPTAIPIQVTDPNDPTGFLMGVAAIAAGGAGTTFSGYSVALLADGTVRTWGDNRSGQLGDGTSGGFATAPVQVVDPSDPTGFLTGVAAISAWGRHTVSLMGDGTLRAFGENGDGQIGDGTSANIRTTPVAVADPSDPTGFLTGVAAIAAGGYQTMALLGDGTVRAWGNNYYGEVGDGTPLDRSLPTQVIDPSDPTGNLTNVSAIGCGAWHCMAVTPGGNVRPWGRNWEGQIGDGSILYFTTPIQVLDPADPTGYLQIATGLGTGWNHSIALLDDRTVRTWGSNRSGNLGDGTDIDRATLVQVQDPADPTGCLPGVGVVAGGGNRTCGLLHDGTLRGWGYGAYGGLGDGSTATRWTPVQVVDLPDPTGFLTGVEAVAPGSYHTAVLIRDGTVRIWGYNDSGQLGDGTNTDSLVPVQVIDPSDPTGFLTGAAAVAGGTGHTLALLRDGTVRAWGNNLRGQLGDGTTNDSNTPVQVVDPTDPSGFLTGVVAISLGGDHSVALMTDGTVRTWGYNDSGQLGDGSRMSSTEPLVVIDPLDPTGALTDITAIAAGSFHTVALKDDRTVRTWGRNMDGQLGDGLTITSPEPVQVVDPGDPTGFLTEVTAVAAGYEYTVALK